MSLLLILFLLTTWWWVSDSSPWRSLNTLGSLPPWGCSSLDSCTQRLPVEPAVSPLWPEVSGARLHPPATSLVPPPPLGGGIILTVEAGSWGGPGQDAEWLGPVSQRPREREHPHSAANMKVLKGPPPPPQKRSAPGSRLQPQEASPKPTPSCRASGSTPDELSLQLKGWMLGKSRTTGGETC